MASFRWCVSDTCRADQGPSDREPIADTDEFELAQRKELTYMSMHDLISAWVKSGDLTILKPALESIPTVRFFIATREVERALCGPWANEDAERRFTEARAVVDAFIGNLRLAVRCPPSRSAKAQLALLDPPKDEVWEFRSRKPKPGVRVFGRFAEPNMFVALTIELREDVDDDFLIGKEACKRQWRRFFSPYRPHAGASLSDYLTNFHQV